MMPEGRIYFAGTYADNLSRGMESCIRSAQRVAQKLIKRNQYQRKVLWQKQ